MRSESKEIYGVNVFGLIAVIKQLRRWWLICELRGTWNDDRKLLVIFRQRGIENHTGTLSVQQRYMRIIELAKDYQLKSGASDYITENHDKLGIQSHKSTSGEGLLDE
ncbi:MAG: hypothetical protein ACTH5W_18730 [Providencia sp.]|uniref:hypothetical protein n=1 Tax=Providencia sp. TaxID=589 RepID=UPI003F9BD422